MIKMLLSDPHLRSRMLVPTDPEPIKGAGWLT